jgi:hypothetical protein
LLELETNRSNVIRPASGFRAQEEFPYSSQPALTAKKTAADKNLSFR